MYQPDPAYDNLYNDGYEPIEQEPVQEEPVSGNRRSRRSRAQNLDV